MMKFGEYGKIEDGMPDVRNSGVTYTSGTVHQGGLGNEGRIYPSPSRFNIRPDVRVDTRLTFKSPIGAQSSGLRVRQRREEANCPADRRRRQVCRNGASRRPAKP